MGLGIFTNKCRKKFACICRDKLFNGKNGVQYKFPYLVRNRQLKGFGGDFPKDSSDALIGLEPLHGTQYVVLHHRESEACNLCGEVNRLAFSQIEQSLHVVICDFCGPSHGVSPVSLKEAEAKVSCKKPVPLSLAAPLAEEELYCRSGELCVYSAVCAPEGVAVLAEFLGMELSDDFLGGKVPVFSLVSGLADFDHADKVAVDMTACDELNEVGVGEPAVHEKIVKTDAALYGFVRLLHQVFVRPLLDGLPVMILTELCCLLSLRKPLLSVNILAFLAMEGEVKHQLAYAVGRQKGKALEAK